MSATRTHPPESSGARPAQPRVRERARDAVVLMVFSVTVSLGCAFLLLLSDALAGSGR